MSHGNVHRQLVAHFAITNDSMDFDGNEVILDADGDTSITSDTDDQIDVRISGADDFKFTANVFTVNEGSDIDLRNGCSITCEGTAFLTYSDTAPSVGVTGMALNFEDSNALGFGTGAAGVADAQMAWVIGDASNHALALALGASQALHVTDVAAIGTDWNVSADTNPTLYIHSDTTPATDYLKIGAHSGTAASIEVVGGTTLTLTGAGNGIINVADGKSLVVGASGSPATFGGGNFIGLEDSGTDPSSTYTNSLALYTPDAGDSLDFLHADGTTDSLGT
jgi:hypothetical protein